MQYKICSVDSARFSVVILVPELHQPRHSSPNPHPSLSAKSTMSSFAQPTDVMAQMTRAEREQVILDTMSPFLERLAKEHDALFVVGVEGRATPLVYAAPPVHLERATAPYSPLTEVEIQGEPGSFPWVVTNPAANVDDITVIPVVSDDIGDDFLAGSAAVGDGYVPQGLFAPSRPASGLSAHNPAFNLVFAVGSPHGIAGDVLPPVPVTQEAQVINDVPVPELDDPFGVMTPTFEVPPTHNDFVQPMLFDINAYDPMLPLWTPPPAENYDFYAFEAWLTQGDQVEQYGHGLIGPFMPPADDALDHGFIEEVEDEEVDEEVEVEESDEDMELESAPEIDQGEAQLEADYAAPVAEYAENAWKYVEDMIRHDTVQVDFDDISMVSRLHHNFAYDSLMCLSIVYRSTTGASRTTTSPI